MATIDTSEWEYSAEGGRHAVFRSTIGGLVLRVHKAFLQGCNIASLDGDGCSEQTYTDMVVLPLLWSYVDQPANVYLSSQQLKDLRRQAIESNRIPDSRQESWEVAGEIQSGAMATVHPDYRRPTKRALGSSIESLLLSPSLSKALPLNGEAEKETSYFAVEFKPKAGYLSTSPLILPCNYIKLYKTRFEILQRLASKGIMKKGWSKGRPAESQYDPLDFFSQDPRRLRGATAALIENPQNNLRMFQNGTVLHDHHAVQTDARRERLSPCMPLMELTETILLSETVLPDIQSLQQLDVIDGDGAVLIYSRLISLVGSTQLAESMLDDITPGCLKGLSNVEGQDQDNAIRIQCNQRITLPEVDWVEKSPFRLPNCDELQAYIALQQSFRSACRDLQHDVESLREELEKTHTKATNCVAGLSVEACVYLLRNWLLSLLCCDLSLFVSFAPISGLAVSEEPLSGPAMTKQRRNRSYIVHHQTADRPGKAFCYGRPYQYWVRLVDIERKSSQKLRKRAESEALVRLYAIGDE